jgi:phospholipid-binding lipoprotein MlaA
MRSNGLSLALAALLAPASAFAQSANELPADAPSPQAAPAVEAMESSAAPTQAPASSDASVASPVPADTGTAVPSSTDETGAASDAVAAGDKAATDPTMQDAAPTPSDAIQAAETTTGNDSTDAERDFAEIYGTQDANALADPNAPETEVAPGAYDPWEKYNRKMHRFNNAVDRRVAKPLAKGYVKVVPRPVRTGVTNFFFNLAQPVTMVNSLLQGKGKQAGQSLGRFLLNSTFGIAGIFDPATRANLPRKSEDFGQTLGVWGWRRSRYVELPLFGPRTVRDVFGMVGDAPLSPQRNVEADRVRIPLQGLQLVDVRAQLLPTDSLREGAEDDYILVRDAWSQRRNYQIFGDRPRRGEGLPDYLQDSEEDSTVPVDAMPVTVPGGG